jgi:hypothetical protein
LAQAIPPNKRTSDDNYRGRSALPRGDRRPPIRALDLKAFAYGDLVPIGFLLRAVNDDPAVRRGLEDLLRTRRQGLLWPYHTGTLVTCIDSALILQGFQDPAGVEALETFADGQGGYLPQLCSEEPERARMTITPNNRHWCQPEYATTCLVTALRAEAGLERKTGVEYLERGYESGGDLYFANPYMTDWALPGRFRGTIPRPRCGSDWPPTSSRPRRGLFLRPLRRSVVHGPGDTGTNLARCRRRGRTPGSPAPGRPDDA